MNIQILKNRIRRILLTCFALTLRYLIPVKRKKVFCWSYSFRKYSCNPRYISEYIIHNDIPDYRIVWALNKDVNTIDVDKRIKIVNPMTIVR